MTGPVKRCDKLDGKAMIIDELLDNSQVLTDTLADKDDEIVALIDASETVLDQIDARRDELAAVLGDGSAVVTTMSELLTQKRAELDRILTRLDTVTDVIDRRQDDVDTILSWAGPTFDQVSAIGSHTRPRRSSAPFRSWPQMGSRSFLSGTSPIASTPLSAPNHKVSSTPPRRLSGNSVGRNRGTWMRTISGWKRSTGS